MDFGLGKRLTNLPALRQIGYTANRRLLRRPTTQPRPDHRHRMSCTPSATPSSPTTAPASPGCASPTHEPRPCLHILLIFRLHPNGFTNRDLRALLAQLLGHDRHASPPARPPTTCAGSVSTA